MIQFIEHESPGYTGRTLRNISKTEMTLAFAMDFNSAGEKLTKSLCEKLNKPYQAVDLISGFSAYNRIAPIVRSMDVFDVKRLNIAGNGIYSLRQTYTQRSLDDFIYAFMVLLIREYGYAVDIYSGGQTGVDEAALKFADKTGLPAVCNFPKRWLFRDIRGNDIRDRVKFLERFGPIYPELY